MIHIALIVSPRCRAMPPTANAPISATSPQAILRIPIPPSSSVMAAS
jgi:hypothetical protein